MKSTKHFNNVSAKLLAKIPKLKPEERVVFQMLNGVPNPEPDEKERSRHPILYGKMQIPTNYRIYDEFQVDENGKEVGGMVDVGCVDIWVGDKPEKFRRLVPGESGGSYFQGKFELVGGKVADEELYEVLYLHPQREGSPCRDNGQEAIFKIVNVKADSQKTLTAIDTLREALDILKKITHDERLEVMAALNQPTYQDEDVLKAKVSELAKENPEDFIKAYNRKDRGNVALLKKAFDANMITYDVPTGNVLLGKTQIAVIPANDMVNFVQNLAEELKKSKNGESVIDNIKSQLGAKELVS